MLRNGLEPWHLLIVAIVVIVLFGSKKLPDTARAVGKSLRILKSETKAMKEDGATSTASDPDPSAQVAPSAIRTTGEPTPARPATESTNTTH
ncbi:Sec-independent protein translocase subunit TatA [Streptomyces sp. NPDC057908]|uniref:Sec-independent protein translocase subunit TatA n=1 Tax=unclassified Streptomyces TaxID=2593676 RepID=UPI002E11BCB9|nr:Sec-independent protein translocase subunit TatA [Streptomyces sp. NBC_01224]